MIETDIKKLRGVIVSGEEWSEVDKMLRDWWSRCVRGHPIVSNGKGGRVDRGGLLETGKNKKNIGASGGVDMGAGVGVGAEVGN